MKLVRTAEGRLLIWERGTTRYTLGYRIRRFARRAINLRATHPSVHGKRFGVHLIRFPMTEVEKRARASAKEDSP